MTSESASSRVLTGVERFDEIVNGGLIANHSYLLRGSPGAGKSTFGLHFLSEGVRSGEDVLYINLGEEVETIKRVSENFGFPIESIEILDLSPAAGDFTEDASYDVFSSAEVEQQPLKDSIAETVTDLSPDRVLVDPVTQLRYLSPDDYQFRKQLLSMLRYLTAQEATVLFTSQSTAEQPDDDLQFLSDGIISLDSNGKQRIIEVTKFRGSDFSAGKHSMAITSEGIEVYPILPLESRSEVVDSPEQLSSGIPEVDRLLGGGVERGTTTFITGPSGVGKSTLGTVFMKESAARGKRSKLYLFEEGLTTLTNRCRAVNIPIDEMRKNGSLDIEVMESSSLDANQFATNVRDEVEINDTDMVMIDGMEGYQLTVNDGELLQPLHRLTRYLSNRDVTTLMLAETKDIGNGFEITDHGGTYLADNVIFLRHIEILGEMRKAIGVLKKRMSDYERALREFEITEHGIRVGDPMTELRGILTGQPDIADEGEAAQLVEQR